MNIFYATVKDGRVELPPGTEFTDGDEVEVRLRLPDSAHEELPEEFHGADPASFARWKVLMDSIPPIEDPERFSEELRQIFRENRGKPSPVINSIPQAAER